MPCLVFVVALLFDVWQFYNCTVAPLNLRWALGQLSPDSVHGLHGLKDEQWIDTVLEFSCLIEGLTQNAGNDII